MNRDRRVRAVLLAAMVLAGCQRAPTEARPAAPTAPVSGEPSPAAAPADTAVVSDWERLMPEQARTLRPPPVIGGPGLGAARVPGGLMDDNGSGTLPGMVIDHTGTTRAPQFGSSEVVASVEGNTLSLDGYVVPLESDDQGRLSELLFVPFQGACIHVPPPPPNQIIRVVLRTPMAMPGLWDAFHLSGTLHIAHFDADIASASYESRDAVLQPVGG